MKAETIIREKHQGDIIRAIVCFNEVRESAKWLSCNLQHLIRGYILHQVGWY